MSKLLGNVWQTQYLIRFLHDAPEGLSITDSETADATRSQAYHEPEVEAPREPDNEDLEVGHLPTIDEGDETLEMLFASPEINEYKVFRTLLK